MSLQEIEALMPHDLINAKPVSAVIKEFFGSSQARSSWIRPTRSRGHAQAASFSARPGGLTERRVRRRDVHPTHYGRVCPIETPEGPNIGLIASLSTYARVNEYGFIETAYQLVEDSKLTGVVKYMTALEEAPHTIAQANTDSPTKTRLPMSSSRRGMAVSTG